MPKRIVERLTDAQMAEIATAPSVESDAALATRLQRQYHTIRKARRRLRAAGGWMTPLLWNTCTECGKPVATPAGPIQRQRLAHVACAGARNVRYSRQARVRRPGLSTRSVRAFRQQQPEAFAASRERERARFREQWPTLRPAQRQALLAPAHAADQRDYQITLELAEWQGAPWTADDDRYLIEYPNQAARLAGLALGRTIWSIRRRRVQLRRQGLLPPGSRTRPKRADWIGSEASQ